MAKESKLEYRNEVFEGILRDRCKDPISLNEFRPIYFEELEKRNVTDQMLWKLADYSIMERIGLAPYAISSRNNTFRHYRLDHYDYTALYRGLNLGQYNNLVIGTLKFFREEPRLMKQYDIRDEYELHNLIKKTWKKWNPKSRLKIRFEKMPTLAIGDVDRKKQTVEFYEAHAPILLNDAALLFEEMYGINYQTALANYFRKFVRNPS